MSTRRIDNDGAEYYGPFIPRIGVRSIYGFISKYFRPRSCEIEIDGNAGYPCPMFYSKQCAAPCVKTLCGEDEYLGRIELIRLFLRNERSELESIVTAKVSQFAEELEFERAAEWRDILLELQSFWKSRHKRYWKDNVKDSWKVELQGGDLVIYLDSRRSTKILEKRAFAFDCEKGGRDKLIFETMLNFYLVYMPSEIRIFFDFKLQERLEGELSKRFDHPVRLIKQTAGSSLTPKVFIRPEPKPVSPSTLRKKLKRAFGLSGVPERIEAYGVAHTSGSDVVASGVVWSKGKFAPLEEEVWYLGNINESDSLARIVALRFASGSNPPDLMLINGGKAMIKAVVESCGRCGHGNVKVISPVGASGESDRIRHFLNESLEIVEVDDPNVIRLADKLSDAVRDLASRTHSMIRNTSHFYELARILPGFSESDRRSILKEAGSIKRLKNMGMKELAGVFGGERAHFINEAIRNEAATAGTERKLIPVRFDDLNGDAEDLQPLETLNL